MSGGALWETDGLAFWFITLRRFGLSRVILRGLASMMCQRAASTDGACRTFASSSSAGFRNRVSVTPVCPFVLSVIPLLVEEGGGWGGGESSARQPVLGDGLWWFTVVVVSPIGPFLRLGSGFGCFDAPSARPSLRGKNGLRGQDASPVPCGPGPNA